MQLSPSSVSVNFNLTGLALPGFLPFATGTGGAPSGTAVAPADFTQMFPGLASAPAAVDQPLDELAITPKPQAAMDAASTIFAFWLPMMPVTPAPLPANDAEPAIAGEAVENDGASADSAVQEPGLRPETRNAHGWSRRDRAGLMRCETESPQDESNATKRETSPTMLPPLPVSVAVPSNERAEALTKEPVSPSSENPRLPQNAGVRGGISEIPVSPFEGSPTVGRGATAQKPISTRAFECEPPLEDGPSAVEPTAVAFSSISTNQLGFAATEKSLLTVEQSLPAPVLSSQPVMLQSRGNVRDVVTAFGAPVSPPAAIRFIPALQAEGEAQIGRASCRERVFKDV